MQDSARAVKEYTIAILLIFLLGVFALSEKQIIKVISEDASVHLYPDAKSQIIGRISSGSFLNTEYRDGDWFRVNFRPDKDAVMKSGFIHQKDVKDLEVKKRSKPQLIISGKRAIVSANDRFKGEPVSLQFRDVDIRDIIAVLCEVGGWSVVFDQAVTGKISCELKNIPWDQALDVILKTQRLGKTAEGKVFRIGKIKDLMDER